MGQDIQRRRNEALRYVSLGDRGRLNSIRFGENESETHAVMKFNICWALHMAGKHFYTEAVLVEWSGKVCGRADILVLDDFRIIEIVCKETEKSIEAKRHKYPEVFDIEVVRC